MNASDTIPTGLRPIWRSTKGYLQLIATWLKFRKYVNYNEAPWKGKRLYTHEILLHFQRDFTKSAFPQGDALGWVLLGFQPDFTLMMGQIMNSFFIMRLAGVHGGTPLQVITTPALIDSCMGINKHYWSFGSMFTNCDESPWRGSKNIAQGIVLGISALPIYTPWKGKRLYTHQILLHFQRDFTKSTFPQGDALGWVLLGFQPDFTLMMGQIMNSFLYNASCGRTRGYAPTSNHNTCSNRKLYGYK